MFTLLVTLLLINLIHVIYENDGIAAGNVWVPTINHVKSFALVCENEYYSCEPAKAGFGNENSSKIRPVKVNFCI